MKKTKWQGMGTTLYNRQSLSTKLTARTEAARLPAGVPWGWTGAPYGDLRLIALGLLRSTSSTHSLEQILWVPTSRSLDQYILFALYKYATGRFMTMLTAGCYWSQPVPDNWSTHTHIRPLPHPFQYRLRLRISHSVGPFYPGTAMDTVSM